MDTQKSKKLFSRKTIALLFTIIMLVSILPLLVLAGYDCPSSDDFGYSVKTSQVWNDTGSVGSLLTAAFQQTVETYHDWQGSYTTTFLISLQPAIFGLQYYGISVVITLLLFVFSLYFLLHTVFMVLLKADKYTYVTVAALVSICCVNFVFSPSEAFYWCASSYTHTFGAAFFFIMVSLLLRFCCREKNTKRYWLLLLLCPIIGGMNLTAVLLSTVFAAMLLLYMIIKRRYAPALIICTLSLLIVFMMINIFAPGNAVRMATAGGNSFGVIRSVIMSVRYAVTFSASWCTLPFVLISLFALPMIYTNAAASPLRFSRPLLVAAASYLFIGVMFAPSVYTFGMAGPPRVINNSCYLFYILFFINVYYLCGWLSGKIKQICKDSEFGYENFSAVVKKIFVDHKTVMTVLLSIALVMSLTTVDYNKISCVSAVDSLLSGEAASYCTQVRSRIELFYDNDITDKTVAELTAKPYLLYYVDVDYNSDWFSAE